MSLSQARLNDEAWQTVVSPALLYYSSKARRKRSMPRPAAAGDAGYDATFERQFLELDTPASVVQRAGAATILRATRDYAGSFAEEQARVAMQYQPCPVCDAVRGERCYAMKWQWQVDSADADYEVRVLRRSRHHTRGFHKQRKRVPRKKRHVAPMQTQYADCVTCGAPAGSRCYRTIVEWQVDPADDEYEIEVEVFDRREGARRRDKPHAERQKNY